MPEASSGLPVSSNPRELDYDFVLVRRHRGRAEWHTLETELSRVSLDFTFKTQFGINLQMSAEDTVARLLEARGN